MSQDKGMENYAWRQNPPKYDKDNHEAVLKVIFLWTNIIKNKKLNDNSLLSNTQSVQNDVINKWFNRINFICGGGEESGKASKLILKKKFFELE